MAAKYSTIDEYLASADPAQRAALQEIRAAIKAAAPNAEECISYQLPTFRQNGGLIAFGAARNHCALYPMSDSVVHAFKNDLKQFRRQPGTNSRRFLSFHTGPESLQCPRGSSLQEPP